MFSLKKLLYEWYNDTFQFVWQDPESGLQGEQNPRPVLKLANFAVDPGAAANTSATSGPDGGPPTSRGLKLANFAVDPSQNHESGKQLVEEA